MMSAPAIKFIGNKEMVIPIIHQGHLLSHKDYLNYFYPEIIEIIDSNGLSFRFKKAELLGETLWIQSLIHLSLLWKTRPILLEEPRQVELTSMKKKVCQFIRSTRSKRGIPKEEKDVIIDRVMACKNHSSVINVVHSVSYWK